MTKSYAKLTLLLLSCTFLQHKCAFASDIYTERHINELRAASTQTSKGIITNTRKTQEANRKRIELEMKINTLRVEISGENDMNKRISLENDLHRLEVERAKL